MSLRRMKQEIVEELKNELYNIIEEKLAVERKINKTNEASNNIFNIM